MLLMLAMDCCGGGDKEDVRNMEDFLYREEEESHDPVPPSDCPAPAAPAAPAADSSAAWDRSLGRTMDRAPTRAEEEEEEAVCLLVALLDMARAEEEVDGPLPVPFAL
jgi:hypothetical protein